MGSRKFKINIKLEIIVTVAAFVIFTYYSGKVIGKALYYLLN